MGHGEGFAGARHPKKDLMWHTIENSPAQCFDGLRLIAFGLELREEFESVHGVILQQKKERGKGHNISFKLREP